MKGRSGLPVAGVVLAVLGTAWPAAAQRPAAAVPNAPAAAVPLPVAQPSAAQPSAPPPAAAQPAATPPAPAQPDAAQPAATQPAPAPQPRTALQQLFENVNFWTEKGQSAMAMQELDRVLTLAPRDPDALATAARIAFQSGQFEAGQRYRAQLALVAPNDPRLPSLQAEKRMSAADLQTLAEARAAAASGKKDEAVRDYKQLFQNGPVPDSLAIEYDLALGSSSQAGFDVAGPALAAVAKRWPADPAFQLAYAQLETYNEGARADGIDALAKLAGTPGVAMGARMAWREALTWQGGDARTRDQIVAYLKMFPHDAELEAKLKDLNATLPDEGVLDRMNAYEAGESGDQAAAERWFEAALRFDPNDAEAMIMLSNIRRQEGRTDEADAMVAKALELAPDRHDEFIKDIGFDPALLAEEKAAQKAAIETAAQQGGKANRVPDDTIRRAYAHVAALTKRGEYAQAEAELLKLMGKRPAPGNFVQLGYIQLRAGRLPQAEASFKRVLATNPRNSAALGGLAGVYDRQGRESDAAAIYARLGTQPAGAASARAAALRLQAQASTDPAQKVELYRQAIAAAPENPWLRLELARALLAQHHPDQAEAVMASVAGGTKPRPEEVQAALIWSQEHGDPARTQGLIAMLPPKLRTEQIVQLQQETAAQLAVRQAQAAGSPAAVRSGLLQVAAAPDPTGNRVQAVAAAFMERGDKAAVRDAVRTGLASTRAPTQAQRVVYAGLLSQAGFYDEAQTLLHQVTPGTLQPGQRTAYNGLADGLAIQRADSLNREGKRADAYDTLSPRLQADPSSTGLNLAVSRLYTADGKPQQGLQVAEAALARSPGDLDAMRATVGAAIAAGNVRRADEIAARAVAQQPADPRGYLMQADIARAQNEPGAALAALRRARAARQQQLSDAQ